MAAWSCAKASAYCLSVTHKIVPHFQTGASQTSAIARLEPQLGSLHHDTAKCEDFKVEWPAPLVLQARLW